MCHVSSDAPNASKEEDKAGECAVQAAMNIGRDVASPHETENKVR
jgi:hypothetical protein